MPEQGRDVVQDDGVLRVLLQQAVKAHRAHPAVAVRPGRVQPLQRLLDRVGLRRPRPADEVGPDLIAFGHAPSAVPDQVEHRLEFVEAGLVLLGEDRRPVRLRDGLADAASAEIIRHNRRLRRHKGFVAGRAVGRCQPKMAGSDPNRDPHRPASSDGAHSRLRVLREPRVLLVAASASPDGISPRRPLLIPVVNRLPGRA